jgi:hypothetical protein
MGHTAEQVRSYSKACSAREHTPYSLGDACQVEVPVKDGLVYARPMAFTSCLRKCEWTRGRVESIILMVMEEVDVGRHQPLRRHRLRWCSVSACEVGRTNEMFTASHENFHVWNST